MNIKTTKLAAAGIPLLLSITAANAVPVPGGTLDPMTIHPPGDSNGYEQHWRGRRL